MCGDGNDLLVHLSAYEQLVGEQIRQDKEYKRVMSALTEAGKFPAQRL